jgi:hypothetical protein
MAAAGSKAAAAAAPGSGRGVTKQPAAGEVKQSAHKPATRGDAEATSDRLYGPYIGKDETGVAVTLPGECFNCWEHVQELLSCSKLGDALLPPQWQQECIKCLQMDPADGPIMWNGLDLQKSLTSWLARVLLRSHGMQPDADVWYDPRKLPPSPSPGFSAVCHSCMVNWVAEGSSMDVVTDRDKMAHCHACLKYYWQGDDAEVLQQIDLVVMIEYALASWFLGEFITSPMARELTGGSQTQKELGKTTSSSTKGTKASAATAAGKTAGETWLQRSTSADRDIATAA